jgi:hypothetical protein
MRIEIYNYQNTEFRYGIQKSGIAEQGQLSMRVSKREKGNW